jgi:hypothetical protein
LNCNLVANPAERNSRRNGNIETEVEPSINVPPLIPQKLPPRQRISNRNNEQELFSRSEENHSSPTLNAGVNYANFNSEFRRQMNNTGETSNIRDTTSNSPGEITQF